MAETKGLSKVQKFKKFPPPIIQTQIPASIDKQYPITDGMLLFLARTKVSELQLTEREVVTVKNTDTLPRVFKTLIVNNVLSAPVVNEIGEIFSFIDMADVTSFAVKLFSLRGGGAPLTFDKLEELFKRDEEFMKSTVTTILRNPTHRDRNPFRPLSPQFSAFYAVETIARYNLHRLAILDFPSKKLVNILTQSALIKFLVEHLDLLGEKRKKPVRLIPNVIKNVETIDPETPTIDAFNFLLQKNIHGTGIVNKEGKLLGSLSVRDIKGILSDGSLFSRLYLPVYDYLAYLRENDRANEFPKNLVTVNPNATIEKVLTKLYQNHIHRLFIVDSKQNMKPIGVISLGDIILEVLC